MNAYTKLQLAMTLLVLAALGVIISASQSTRAAGPWYVAPGGSDGNDCLGSITACATINGALNKPGFVAGDTILVATGVYTGTGDQVVLLDKTVTLSGGWDASFTTQSGTSTIDAQYSGRGIRVSYGVIATVELFTVLRGSGTGYAYGNGIWNEGNLTLNRSRVSLSTNAIYNANNSTLTLNRCVVSDNTDSGIVNNGLSVTINDSTINGNAGTYGGGINSSVGGIITLNNSTISSNTASLYGGGIYGESTSFGLYNSTISDNTAWAGGGIYRYSGISMQNTLIAGNTAGYEGPDCWGNITSGGYNLIGDTSDCNLTSGAGDLVNVNPQLGLLIGTPEGPRYHPLLSGSPAIDAGDPAGCSGSAGPLTTDQRGAARVGRCDIGAYEYTIPGPAASVYAFAGARQYAKPFSVYLVPLQALVLDGIGSPVNNAAVVFSAPVTGASGTFTDTGTYTTTATTAVSGIVTATTFTANGLLGSYAVTATVGSVVTPANFLLGNYIYRYVASTGNDYNDCIGPSTACATINGALNKPGFVAGDTILVATGTYAGSGIWGVVLNKSATLSGGWNAGFTTQSGTSTIDGQEARRGITVDMGVIATIERFVIQNCLSSGAGGGISNRGTLTLNNSTVTNNSAYDGGGISGGNLILNNSVISGNVASDTGYSSAGGIGGGGILTLNNSTITGNSNNGIYILGGSLTLNNTIISANGSNGISSESSTATLNNVTISGNGDAGIVHSVVVMILNNSIVSNNKGGGIRNGGHMTLQNTAINNNVTDNSFYGGGGGIYNSNALTMTNCNVSGNTVSGTASIGGGIYNNNGGITLNSTTVSDNTANQGGGVYNSGGIGLRNSILTGNTASSGPDCYDIYSAVHSAGYNLIGSTSGCTFSPTTGDLTDVDAKLSPLEDSPGYHPLLPDSPAVNGGNPAGCVGSTGVLTTDQRGSPRFGRCDIGAYELQPIGFSTKKVDPPSATRGDLLTYTIVLTNGGAINLANIHLTDTVPVSLTYVDGSLTATSGSYGYNSRVITWTGSVNAGEMATITYKSTVSPTITLNTWITNSVVINGGGEILTRTATATIPPATVFLSCVFRDYCASFFDDFSNPASGWEVGEDGYARSEYLNGEFRVLTKQSGYFYWFQAPGCKRQNYIVEADAHWVGTPGNRHGLLFGITANYNRYYLFAVNTDYQQFQLLRRDPSGFTTLVAATYSAAIHSGTASNHLEATRSGSNITLEVNGTVLGTWTDSAISGLTGAGIVTNPYSNIPVSDAHFDNFAVTTLPSN